MSYTVTLRFAEPCEYRQLVIIKEKWVRSFGIAVVIFMSEYIYGHTSSPSVNLDASSCPLRFLY